VRLRLTRRGLLAGAVPLAASLPFARNALAQSAPDLGEAQKQMTGDAHAAGHAHTMAIGADVAAPGGPNELDDLLLPPEALPHEPGRVREYEIVALDRELEVAEGVVFPAWTYNGSVPGPVIRATQDDLVRVTFRNEGSSSHNMHFHGIHAAKMDAALSAVPPGGSFVYEFRARPAGMHLYHCHHPPVSEHLNRGLYGAFIVDPAKPRRKAQELVMVLSGFDTNGDDENEILAVNGRAFYYAKYPITVRRSSPVRIYLANLTEFAPVNSFHLHGNFFRLYRTGTTRGFEYTDTVTLGQGERCVLEIDFEEAGVFMFHSHQSRHADRGWTGFFNVVDAGGPTGFEAAASAQLQAYAEQFAECRPCVGTLGAKALIKY
jgi:FtsP/CotA-like multicopper oxidase with cupredoxin domain